MENYYRMKLWAWTATIMAITCFVLFVYVGLLKPPAQVKPNTMIANDYSEIANDYSVEACQMKMERIKRDEAINNLVDSLILGTINDSIIWDYENHNYSEYTNKLGRGFIIEVGCYDIYVNGHNLEYNKDKCKYLYEFIQAHYESNLIRDFLKNIEK